MTDSELSAIEATANTQLYQYPIFACHVRALVADYRRLRAEAEQRSASVLAESPVRVEVPGGSTT